VNGQSDEAAGAEPIVRVPPRVLVHLPHPEPPRLEALPQRRPARGEEFPPGWTVADYNLAVGDHEGEAVAYEVWVVPLIK
jgi:hypothetical protein